MQFAIIAAPNGGILIEGAGGLRETGLLDEVDAPDDDRIRILYVYFEEFSIVLLVAAYRGQRVTITIDGREEIRDFIERERAAFACKPRG